ncbi:Polyphosphate:AMP phosphotransferase [Nitrosococcus oceani ATCC 19707]|uniref:Polyphosphate:AMP phosphotransferase n=2 Tax=Nitrosococcus oceani TaxID=1229 RepID=Q3J912_NITOC|nr:polyphosphate kinase 2 family protein [Nitrosococcus oceani]ABA58684.1 Polyphosphate:AMP phosphotransferase [Nitrosococcus oceani ATCC 19707]EDZ67425.1 Polyphosphate kinase 2 superfamily [Nitrosococcus oceani AFC27]KFI18867.1 phosphate:nucleotide phosphotransferase [Nitrosococcus oceani C-27]GEM19227.1 polyphosphate--nucleotide phosphotransferase [Nitrosococcus oceani]
MPRSINTDTFTFTGKKAVKLNEHETKIKNIYQNKADYRKLIKASQKKINDLQRMMYAHDRYSMLLVFQAMDAAGKDGTIRAIMSGVNAHGITVHAFKEPSAEELDHDFLWRTTVRLPQRGRIGIFNRSYYEEVLVVKVHPEIVQSMQRLPANRTDNLEELWRQRYTSIRDFEKHLWHNGTRVLKFFLHLGRDEQRQRFLDRIDEPDKNWKFSEGDVKERKFWDDYQQAYQDAINATATKNAPWFVVPADDKKNMRLIVAQIILEQLKSLDMEYPEVTPERRDELQQFRKKLLQA